MTNERKTGHIFPKQQLEVAQAPAEKGYGTGGKTLVTLNAKNLSLLEGDPLIGRALKYTVFNADLKNYILKLEIGARFLCDIEERDRPDSEYGPDRNINQVYVDGNPVSTKKGAGGGGYRGRTIEEDLILEGVKRRSIEGQTAIAQVGLALTCPTPIPGEALGIDDEGWFRILVKYWQAVERSLDNFLADPPKPVQKPQDKPQAAAKTEKVSKDAPPTTDPIKHVGDLLTRSLKLKPPVVRDDLCIALNVSDPSEIKDLEAAWKTTQELSAAEGRLPDLPF